MLERSDLVVELSDLEKLEVEMEAKKFALVTRERLGISLSEPINPIKFLESQNIIVLQMLDLGTSGFIRILEGKHIIFLNGSEPLGRQHYTAIHEYAHIIRDIEKFGKLQKLTEEERSLEYSRMEYFAFQFADYFLMPDSAILYSLRLLNIHDFSSISTKQILQLQAHFQLSYRQITRMLNKVGILSKEKREQLNEVSSSESPNELFEVSIKYGFDTTLISPLTESRIPQKYLDAMIENIKEGRITTRKVKHLSDLLHMPSLLAYIEHE